MSSVQPCSLKKPYRTTTSEALPDPGQWPLFQCGFRLETDSLRRSGAPEARFVGDRVVPVQSNTRPDWRYPSGGSCTTHTTARRRG